MNDPVHLTAQARADVDHHAAQLEARLPGRGDDFVDEVLATLARIGATPRLYAVAYGQYRRAPLHGFPYGIFYRAGASDHTAVAVLHDRQDLRVLKRR